ncbi:MAG: hypothetical protein JO345_20510 [Streptosporangiaceae bacterium]|nr:hypothetical protein [Streptosporangiaceae bacterium]
MREIRQRQRTFMVGSVFVGCLLAAAITSLLVIRRRYIVVDVVGGSMRPVYEDGDRVLIRRGNLALRAGSVVVLRPPALVPGKRWPMPAVPGTAMPRLANKPRWLIKRVAALAGDRVPDDVRPAVGGAVEVPTGALVVLADHPAGTDSRRFGFVLTRDVLGHVVAKLPPRAAGSGLRHAKRRTVQRQADRREPCASASWAP